MIQSPQEVQLSRDGVTYDATVSWRFETAGYVVTLASPAFETLHRRADDAFEALCRLRAELEPAGWRIGVAGAQRDVWPSGMARDQGGGLMAYRIRDGVAGERVETFQPVDPGSVVTLAEQSAEAQRHFGVRPYGT